MAIESIGLIGYAIYNLCKVLVYVRLDITPSFLPHTVGYSSVALTCPTPEKFLSTWSPWPKLLNKYVSFNWGNLSMAFLNSRPTSCAVTYPTP